MAGFRDGASYLGVCDLYGTKYEDNFIVSAAHTLDAGLASLLPCMLPVIADVVCILPAIADVVSRAEKPRAGRAQARALLPTSISSLPSSPAQATGLGAHLALPLMRKE